MKLKLFASCFSALLVLMLIDGLSAVQAQGPDDRPQRRGRETRTAPTVENIVARMMAFDKNKDGQLTKDEITDPRLMRVFERADANHDGIVTRDEMSALAKKMMAEMGSSRGGPGGGGPDGDDGPGGGPGGGGFGGPRGFGFGPPPPRRKPGEVLPAELQNDLDLTADQKAKVAELQKEVIVKMDKILTEKQKAAALKTIGPRDGDRPPPPPDE